MSDNFVKITECETAYVFMKGIHFFVSKIDNLTWGPLGKLLHSFAGTLKKQSPTSIQLDPKGGFLKQTPVKINFH